MRRPLAPALVLAALLLLCSSSAQAWVPGNLDPSFGVGGKVTTRIGNAAAGDALAIQPDGKIVMAGWGWDGDFVVARYLPDGSLDWTFGTGGVATAPFGQYTGAQGRAVALQADGKIVVAGTASNYFALGRFDADGSFDTSFGGDGKVELSVGEASYAYAVAVQPDGKIVAAGRGAGWPGEFALARLEPDGSIDSTFGSDGTVTTAVGPISSVRALAIQPDGKIVTAGYPDFALARYEPDGSLDATFGSGGIVTTAAGSEDGAWALALQPDGKIVVASDTNREHGFGLVRYLTTGALDATFGSGGETRTELECCSRATGVVLQPDGKIVVAGETTVGAIQVFALARFDEDGILDPTFGKAGVVVSDLSTYPHIVSGGAAAVALQSDGKIVAGGAITQTGDGNPTFGLARYLVTAGCRVPDVRGRRVEAAKARVRRAGCSVGRIKHVFSRRVERGRVISQLPAPGAGRPAGAQVKLVVSNGKRKRH
jgi:uncharacterized delta-60 repeat protein